MDFVKPYVLRDRVQVHFDEPSLTRQAFKNDCDVNLIVKKYGRSGQVPAFDVSKPVFGDFSSVEDYHTALNRIIDSRAAFDRLPASLRSRFDNDPVKLLDFVSDERNHDEAVRLGICKPKVVGDKTENQSSAQVPT